MRGPKPKPTVIQVARGDPGKRAKRRLRTEIRAPQTGIMRTPPKWLPAAARAFWRAMMRRFGELEAQGQRLVTDLDQAAMIRLCQAYADLRKAIIEIERHGEVIEYRTEEKRDKEGKVVQVGKLKYVAPSPWVAMRRDADERLKNACNEFGLNPAARTRVQVEKVEKKGEMDKFMEEFG